MTTKLGLENGGSWGEVIFPDPFQVLGERPVPKQNVLTGFHITTATTGCQYDLLQSEKVIGCMNVDLKMLKT